tara:strand:+ start:4700 stop:6490 length:1791 start_codon:yes stop_codon:yes gene_type:complete
LGCVERRARLVKPALLRRSIVALAALCLGISPAWGDACGERFVPISKVQGSGERSPLAGKLIAVEGLVSGLFPGSDQLSGLYLISAQGDADDRVQTSEGLFVHIPVRKGSAPGMMPALGERIRVRGRVREYHGLTELANARQIEICSPGEGPPAAEPLRWPLAVPEQQEAMLVEVGPLTVTDQRELERFGSLRLATERLQVPTQVVPPGRAAEQHARSNRERSIVLDDGSIQTSPGGRYELSWDAVAATGQRARPIRRGDRTGRIRAILDFRFGEWRLQPVSEVAVLPTNARPEPLPASKGLRLVAFNLGNFFNGDGRGYNFSSGRGASDRGGYMRQRDQLVTAIHALKPDLLAVAEIENDGHGPNSAVADLARALGSSWRYVDFGGATGGDAIANGILYNSARLTQVGQAATLEAGAFARGNRPALAAAFRAGKSGETRVVVANHFKSKRCNNATGAQVESGDGQGCWGPLRAQAAAELVAWLKTDPTGTGSTDQVVMGDLNSYRREAPLMALADGGFFNPSAVDSYSYSFKGEVGTLDYILPSAGLESAVLQSGTWRANVDEPAAPAELGPLRGEPWRASDHDPVWLDLKWPAR